MVAVVSDFATLISDAVAARMTPDFIEKEVQTRVDKLLVESVDRALRSYSDTGKLIEKAVADALQVDRLDLPSYGHVVTQMLQVQIARIVSDVVAGRLADDMTELLQLAPKEVKLSEIAEWMLEQHDDGYGRLITVELDDDTRYGSRWLYLDERQHHERRASSEARHRLLISNDGTISGGWISERPLAETKHYGRSYGLEQRLRAYIACGTKITLDIEYVVTSKGDD